MITNTQNRFIQLFLFLTGVICCPSTEAMNNGASNYKHPDSSPPPPRLLCTDCGDLLDTAWQAECGHKYHKKCIENLLGKICNAPGCEEMIFGGTIYLDKGTEKDVEKYRSIHSQETVRNTDKPTALIFRGETCTICNKPCDADSVSYYGIEQDSPAHAVCIINQSEQAQTNQNVFGASLPNTNHSQQKDNAVHLQYSSIKEFPSATAPGEPVVIQQTPPTAEENKVTEKPICIICDHPIASRFFRYIDKVPAHSECISGQQENSASSTSVTNQVKPEDKLLDNDKQTKEITDGMSDIAVSTPQDAMVCHSSPLQLNINPVIPHSTIYRKRELKDYQRVLEDQHGPLNKKLPGFDIMPLYRPAKTMAEKGIEGLKRLIQKHNPAPGFDYIPGKTFHSFLQKLKNQIQTLNRGEYLILLALTNKQKREQEPANLVVISHGIQEDEWDRGDVDFKMGERKNDRYCLLVVSSVKGGVTEETECLQVLTRDEVEQMAYIALLHLFAFWREHVIVLAPRDTSLQPINILQILEGRKISGSETIPFLFSIRNLIKTVAMASGLGFYDFKDQIPLVLEPLKNHLKNNTKCEDKDTKSVDLDTLIKDQFSTDREPRRKYLDSDEEIIKKIKALGQTGGGILKLELSVLHLDSAQYYIFFENSRYYIYCQSDKDLPILTGTDSEYITAFFRFVLLSMQPSERAITYLMDS